MSQEGQANMAGSFLSICGQISKLTTTHLSDKVPLPERHWTRENHARMTHKSQRRVETVLLCAHRLRETGSELSLPTEMWYKILEHPHWSKSFPPGMGPNPEIFSALSGLATQEKLEEMGMFLVAELGLNFEQRA